MRENIPLHIFNHQETLDTVKNGVWVGVLLAVAHISHFQIKSFVGDLGLFPAPSPAFASNMSFQKQRKERKRGRDDTWENTGIHIQHVYCGNVCIDQVA